MGGARSRTARLYVRSSRTREYPSGSLEALLAIEYARAHKWLSVIPTDSYQPPRPSNRGSESVVVHRILPLLELHAHTSICTILDLLSLTWDACGANHDPSCIAVLLELTESGS